MLERKSVPGFPDKKCPDIWFYKPSWYWYGWKTLLPFYDGGSDEYGRRCFVVGWTVTGKVIFAWNICDCNDCIEMREQTLRWKSEYPEEF